MPSTRAIAEFLRRQPRLHTFSDSNSVRFLVENHSAHIFMAVWGGTDSERRNALKLRLIDTIRNHHRTNHDWVPSPPSIFTRTGTALVAMLLINNIVPRRRVRNRELVREICNNLTNNFNCASLHEPLILPNTNCRRVCTYCNAGRTVPQYIVGLTQREYDIYLQSQRSSYENAQTEDEEYTTRRDRQAERNYNENQIQLETMREHLFRGKMRNFNDTQTYYTRYPMDRCCMCGCGTRLTEGKLFVNKDHMKNLERLYRMSQTSVFYCVPEAAEVLILTCICCQKGKVFSITEIEQMEAPWNWKCPKCIRGSCRCSIYNFAQAFGLERSDLNHRPVVQRVVEFSPIDPEVEMTQDSEWFYEADHAEGCQCHYCQHSLIYDPRLGFPRPAGRVGEDFDVEEYRERYRRERRAQRNGEVQRSSEIQSDIYADVVQNHSDFMTGLIDSIPQPERNEETFVTVRANQVMGDWQAVSVGYPRTDLLERATTDSEADTIDTLIDDMPTMSEQENRHVLDRIFDREGRRLRQG